MRPFARERTLHDDRALAQVDVENFVEHGPADFELGARHHDGVRPSFDRPLGAGDGYDMHVRGAALDHEASAVRIELADARAGAVVEANLAAVGELHDGLRAFAGAQVAGVADGAVDHVDAERVLASCYAYDEGGGCRCGQSRAEHEVATKRCRSFGELLLEPAEALPLLSSELIANRVLGQVDQVRKMLVFAPRGRSHDRSCDSIGLIEER